MNIVGPKSFEDLLWQGLSIDVVEHRIGLAFAGPDLLRVKPLVDENLCGVPQRPIYRLQNPLWLLARFRNDEINHMIVAARAGEFYFGCVAHVVFI